MRKTYQKIADRHTPGSVLLDSRRRLSRGFTLRALLVLLLVITAGLIVLAWDRPPQASAQAIEVTSSITQEVDVATYTQVQQLREKLALTNLDLAAMGVSQEQAQGVLTTLKMWSEKNQSTLEQMEGQVKQTKSQLRSAMRQINIGPRNETTLNQLPRLKEDYSRARAQRAALHLEAGQSATAGLAQDQRQVWNTVLSNADAPGRYRYVKGLTGKDKSRLREDMLKRRRGQTATPTEWASLDLAAGQIRMRQQEHLAAVNAAEDTVLPVPAELLDAADLLGNPSP